MTLGGAERSRSKFTIAGAPPVGLSGFKCSARVEHTRADRRSGVIRLTCLCRPGSTSTPQCRFGFGTGELFREPFLVSAVRIKLATAAPD
jgi:hypothetical protein